MRTAYLHIGAPKTGSTAIQAACDQARPALKAQGYHYLNGSRNHIHRLAIAFWQLDDARHLAGLHWQDGDAAIAYRKKVWAALQAEISATNDDLIISAEDLSDFRQSEVDHLMTFLRKHVDRVQAIGYLRDPLDWAVSQAQQAIKWSGDQLETLFDRPRLPHYEARFRPWLAALAPNNIRLRAYPKRNILSDFSQALGLDTPLAEGPRLNAAISHRTALLFSCMNAELPPFVAARHNPFRSYDVSEVIRLPGRRFSLPPETIVRWADALAEDRDWASAVIGEALTPSEHPVVARASWDGGEAAELQPLAHTLLKTTRAAQNARALDMYIRAIEFRDDPNRAHALLDQAWHFSTDRGSMRKIVEEAQRQDRDDCARFFAKNRLMRRLEAPDPGDPILIGNPYDRPWRENASQAGVTPDVCLVES